VNRTDRDRCSPTLASASDIRSSKAGARVLRLHADRCLDPRSTPSLGISRRLGLVTPKAESLEVHTVEGRATITERNDVVDLLCLATAGTVRLGVENHLADRSPPRRMVDLREGLGVLVTLMLGASA